MLESIENYVLVAKPGIIFGNLISAAAGFFLASKGQVEALRSRDSHRHIPGCGSGAFSTTVSIEI